jgi:DNA-binding transcriptional LysR family regulator
MNIHHLELFYYVAKHGGINEAVRNIPYGIQQPAVSGQIIQLEEFLNATLFNRRPFHLTPVGQEIYDFIKPFFDNLPSMTDKICGGMSQHLRIGASETVLRDHFPEILQSVRKKFPGLKLTLRQGHQPSLESWLLNHSIDLAVTLLEGKPPAGLNAAPLLDLPLVLMVKKNHWLQDAEELWKLNRIEDALISLPPSEAVCKHFQQALNKLRVDWFTGIEVSSLDLIETYAAKGFGIELSVNIPRAEAPAGLRIVPLKGVAPVSLGAMWAGKLTPVLRAFLEGLESRAREVGRGLKAPAPGKDSDSSSL